MGSVNLGLVRGSAASWIKPPLSFGEALTYFLTLEFGVWDGLPFLQYLDSQFEDRVISRKSVRGRDWPARSPDLNPLDYFLWGFLKSKVYFPWPRNLDELEANIRREVGNLQPD